MKKIFFSLTITLLIALSSHAQTPQETITEGGVVFSRVKTLTALSSIGFSLSNNNTIATSSGHRAKHNYKCGAGSGGCYCSAIVVSNGEISTCNFPAQTPSGGTEVEGQNGVLPYYNSENDVLIFRP